MKIKFSDQMAEVLQSMPNAMANEWALLKKLYPQAQLGDKSNGGRMGCIRRIARYDNRFQIIGDGASTIALIKNTDMES